MVAATVRRNAPFSGLRPINAARDLHGIAGLIEEAFRNDMDAAGERAVREMRLLGRMGPLVWWLDQLSPVGEGFSPGFVWIEDGRIVGNATVRRATTFGQGWIVGNVAVQEAYRGRGIARRLMEACIDYARDEEASWVALEVRADNAPAYHLYKSLGFEQTGAIIQSMRPAGIPLPDSDEPVGLRVREPRGSEQGKILALARSTTPAGLQWAAPIRENEFSLGWDRHMDLWLSRRVETWRVAETEGRIVGAAALEMYHNKREESRLRMWATSDSGAHAGLLRALLSTRESKARPTLASHPESDAEEQRTLAHWGFRPLRTLAHMRLKLR